MTKKFENGKIYLFRTYGGECIIAKKVDISENSFKEARIVRISVDPRTGSPFLSFIPLCIFQSDESLEDSVFYPELNQMMTVLSEEIIEKQVITGYLNRGSKIVTPPNNGGIIIPN